MRKSVKSTPSATATSSGPKSKRSEIHHPSTSLAHIPKLGVTGVTITQQPAVPKKSVLPPPSQSPNESKKVKFIKEVDFVEHASGERTSFKQEIFGGSLYSKALLRGDDDEIKYEIQNESLKYLEGTKRLFFRKCATFPPELKSFNPKNKRGIWNSSGRAVYYTGQKNSYICKGCHYSGFIQEVVDYSGKTVIIATGKQFIFGINSKVQISLDGGKLLGTMTQSCLSSTYDIKDSSGRLVYKIQAPCFAPCAPFVFWCCKENFELCMDDGVSEIGKITKNWGSTVTVSEFRNCVGIEMDRVDDVRVKALLLGCFFLVEFQYFKGAGNGPIYFIFMLLIFALIIVTFECAGYCPFWIAQTFKTVEKETV